MQSRRLRQLPPYLFDQIDRLKRDFMDEGREVLDLGIGDPDIGAPPELTGLLADICKKKEHHRYPPSRGLSLLIDAVRRWAENEYGVKPDEREVLVTIGSKEAIGHLPLAVSDPGDTVMVPDPGYPVYNSASIFAGSGVITVPLEEKNGFWPDFSGIDMTGVDSGSLMFINYPNNPTAAVADEDKLKEAIEFCRSNNIILANDAAYSEIIYQGRAAALFPLAREAGIPYIEFFSFSKTFCITGWRIGFAIGSPGVIAALEKVKSNLDSGVFGAIQETMAIALQEHYGEITERIRGVFRERRDILAEGLRESDLDFRLPEATFYFWIDVPGEMDSIEFCKLLMEQTGIVATPGVGFGKKGEGYFRLSVTSDRDKIREAGGRLGEFSFR